MSWKPARIFISKKILTLCMRMLKDEIKFKTIRVSEKGQIAIPSDIRKELKIARGEHLLLIKKGNRILLEKPEEFSKRAKSEFEDLIYWNEQVLKKLWSNKEDEIWDEYLKSDKK